MLGKLLKSHHTSRSHGHTSVVILLSDNIESAKHIFTSVVTGGDIIAPVFFETLVSDAETRQLNDFLFSYDASLMYERAAPRKSIDRILRKTGAYKVCWALPTSNQLQEMEDLRLYLGSGGVETRVITPDDSKRYLDFASALIGRSSQAASQQENQVHLLPRHFWRSDTDNIGLIATENGDF